MCLVDYDYNFRKYAQNKVTYSWHICLSRRAQETPCMKLLGVPLYSLFEKRFILTMEKRRRQFGIRWTPIWRLNWGASAWLQRPWRSRHAPTVTSPTSLSHVTLARRCQRRNVMQLISLCCWRRIWNKQWHDVGYGLGYIPRGWTRKS